MLFRFDLLTHLHFGSLLIPYALEFLKTYQEGQNCLHLF